MSSALVKGKLKAAREAIGQKDWAKAERAAGDAISFESSNYNARVFLALAKLNLGKNDESEQAYRQAIEAQPTTLLAWQGLASFYEKTENWPQAIETQRKLADLANEGGDAIKCAEALQKILKTHREHGSSSDVLETLKLFIPDSPYYATLSTLPPPNPTEPDSTTTYEAQSLIQDPLPILQEMIASAESLESSQIAKEIDRRRQRLTTTTSAEETRKQVQREVMDSSSLPSLYEKVLSSHTATDEVRRETEDKLLVFRHTLLLALPDPFAGSTGLPVSESAREQQEVQAKKAGKDKERIRKQVQEMANGMTTLKLPNELAWRIALEWRDMQDENDWDTYNFKRYMDIWPESGLSRLAHLVLDLPDPLAEPDAKFSKPTGDNLTDQINAAFEKAQASSVRAHVLVSKYHLGIKDYESVIEVAEAGLSQLRTLEGEIGQRLIGVRSLLERDLAISLVHHDPPRNHVRAQRLLDSLLSRSPNDLSCLLAKAYIYTSSARFSGAYDLFSRVEAETSPDDEKVKFEARAEKAWALANIEERKAEALDELFSVANEMDKDQDTDRTKKAQAWWRYGQCCWSMDTDEHTDAAYDAFTTSIKRDNTYAPSFTSLGFYYLEAIDPPSHITATKFFQKAFELDEREDVAAKYLADEFAEAGDWDLVEVVARRVVQGDRIAEGDRPAMGSFVASKHAWAWKAIGAAELKAKRYPKAVPALQSAIRGAPKDVNIWLQLALAYRGAGKHVASLKTLVRVRQLDPENWHAGYLVGDVQRQLGLYEAAIKSFEAVQSEPADDDGHVKEADSQTLKDRQVVVKTAVVETQLLLAHSQIRDGFSARGAGTLVQCIEGSLSLLEIEGSSARVAWKLIADSLLKLGQLSSPPALAGDERDPREDMLTSILEKLSEAGIDSKNPILQDLVTVKLVKAKLDQLDRPVACLCIAVLSYSIRVLLHSGSGAEDGDEGLGCAWFDLGHSIHQLKPNISSLHALPAEAEAEEIQDEDKKEKKKQEECTTQAIQCLRYALQKEPLNGNFWNLLGVIAAPSTPKLGQHALIRACELNVRSAVPWTNLALFYLSHEDYELANKAFLRAQVLDPDYPQAWLGQAALARINGEVGQAAVLTEHAAGLSNGSVPDADLSSALTAFENLRSGPSTSTKEAFIRPQFLASRYLRQASHASSSPSTVAAHHLHGLLSERLGLYPEASASLSSAVSGLEAAYEATESPETERRYIIASISLARARLAAGQYAEAIEGIETAVGLLPDMTKSGDGKDTEAVVLKVQAGLIRALASHFSDEMEASLEAFEEARAVLEAASTSTSTPESDTLDPKLVHLKTQTTLLLAGVLYSLGGEDQLAEAESQLLESIYDATTSTPNLPIITALSALAIVQGKADLLSAAVSEVLKLPIDQRIAQDPQGDVAYLLRCEAQLRGDSAAADAALAHAVHADPTSMTGREALQRLTGGSSGEKGEQGKQESGKDWEKRVHASPHMNGSWKSVGKGEESTGGVLVD